MKDHWHVISPDPGVVQSLVKSLKCHPVTAAVLANRNIVTQKAAVDFFSNSFDRLKSPLLLRGINRATERITEAIMKAEPILIFGDYDADGITATVVLLEFLRQVGANVDFYIPHRLTEGYGLTPSHITGVAQPKGIRLIITVDCGSTNHEAVVKAGEAGIDVIITDHHQIPETPPPALAVINPQQQDCPSNLCHLSGVGIAFYLALCLRKRLRESGFFGDNGEPNLKRYCDLVAIGTVADISPMVGENRILTQAGLDVMSAGNRVGLSTLFNVSGCEKQHANTDDLAFRLAPRLNAAGRMDHARQAVRLLTDGNPETAKQIAENLNHLNDMRRQTETKVLNEIMRHIDATPGFLDRKSISMFCGTWHEGVLGIVASRLVRQFFRPTVLITLQNGMAKGSARSIPGFDMYSGLSDCADLLEGFGGHAMAAGLSLKPENFQAFKEKFEVVVHNRLNGADAARRVDIDGEIRFDMITDKLLNELDMLQPFGPDNEEPLFLARNLRVVRSHIVGGSHRRLVLKQQYDPSGKRIHGMHFNVTPEILPENEYSDIVFRLRWNRWKGTKTIQIIIEDV